MSPGSSCPDSPVIFPFCWVLYLVFVFLGKLGNLGSSVFLQKDFAWAFLWGVCVGGRTQVQSCFFKVV